VRSEIEVKEDAAPNLVGEVNAGSARRLGGGGEAVGAVCDGDGGVQNVGDGEVGEGREVLSVVSRLGGGGQHFVQGGGTFFAVEKMPLMR
jgi:hypothetical protein